MKVTVIMLPTGEVFTSVAPQEGVSFEDAKAALARLRERLALQGVPLVGDSPVESHLSTEAHEAVHQAERQHEAAS